MFEPSCGEAAFLLAAGSRLRALGGDPANNLQLFGVDLHEGSVERARTLAGRSALMAELRRADFFEVSSDPRFDAIVGNPPYVRYQRFTGDARTRSREVALTSGVELTALASSWAAFLIHAASFLTPPGRMALVLPAELLSVNYAAAVREFLLRRFGHLRLVLFEERVFPGVTEEVLLLLAEGSGGTREIETLQVRHVDDLLSGEAIASKWRPGRPHEKWTSALMPPSASDIFVALRDRDDWFVPLVSLGETTLGMVTGNNGFFTLSGRDIGELGLDGHDVLRISPPGSRHLRGISFDSGQWSRLRVENKRVFLFRPRSADLSAGARRYIDRGERDEVDHAYKCRVRRPWWRVPLVDIPDAFLTCMNSDAPRIVANDARVRYLNSVHGVFLRRDHRDLLSRTLPLAFLNSCSLLGAELIGRSYGGGILKVEPREADRLPVPSIGLLGAAAQELLSFRDKASALLQEGRLDDVVSTVDEALFSRTDVAPADVQQLHDARIALQARRSARTLTRAARRSEGAGSPPLPGWEWEPPEAPLS